MQNRLDIRHLGHLGCKVAAFGLLATWVMVAQAANPPADSDAVQKRIDALIEQLGDPSFIKREAAKEELEKFGLVAFESLRGAELHANVEIANSATYLLESMKVDWSLPSDSFDVQRLLKDYNDLQQRSKLDALQRLANQDRADAYMALLRLMRYEKDEKLSKAAGLHVMENAVDALMPAKSNARLLNAKAELPWKQLIIAGSSESTRVPAVWLQTFADNLDAATISPEVWQKQVTQERMLLESNARGRSQSRTKTDDEIVKRLYRVVVKLLVVKNQQTAALDFFEPYFDLVSKEQKDAFNDLQWMLEAGLPQAIERLNQQRPDLFARTRNRYLLAEAYLKLGRAEKANQTAAEAIELTNLPPELARRIAQAHPADSEAVQRHTNFDYLMERGLFEWSEAELKRVLIKAAEKGELSRHQELATRQRLANYYWGADEPELSADVWLPIMQKAGLLEESPPDSISKDLQSELMQRSLDDVPYDKYIPSHYYFYLGLAASKKVNWELARQHFRKAVQYDTSDPDLLIAMYKAAQDDTNFGQLVAESIESLESSLRVELEKAESELATARSARTTYENAVAVQCNQLAWLLSCTNRKVNDALMLSQRACHLTPDYGVYLDTLARCHFSAGHIDKAIEIQQRAIKLVPFERSMARQLEEFRAAKK